VEALDEHGRASDLQGDAQHRVEAEHVEQRQHGEHDLLEVAGPPRVGQDLADVAGEVPVGEHRRPGRAGGAAGEQQHGDVARRPLDDRRRLARQEVRHRHGGGHGALRHDGRGGAGGVDERQARLDEPQLPPQLGGGALGVERHGDGARPQHGEVGGDEARGVAGEDRDPVAGADAPLDQRAPGPGHLVAQLAVGRDGVPADQRGPVGRVALDQRRQVHAAASLAGPGRRRLAVGRVSGPGRRAGGPRPRGSARAGWR